MYSKKVHCICLFFPKMKYLRWQKNKSSVLSFPGCVEEKHLEGGFDLSFN